MPNEVRIKASVTGNAKQEIKDIRKGWKDFNSEGVKAGATAAVASKGFDLLGGAVNGAGDFMKQSAEDASNLSETLSKSKVIFGEHADKVERWGESMDTAAGLSKRAALEAAASFGNLFVGLDMGQPKAAQMSEALVQLAGDLASFNNIDPTEALAKLQSGLAGEAEPLRQLGVFLSDAKVKAKAMEMGLGDAHGELTEGEKVLARYQLILDETKTAQGDFARTADGAANSQRTLNAEMENARAELGEKLLPLEKEWINFQKDVGIPALLGMFDGVDKMGDGLAFLNDTVQDAVDGLQFWNESQNEAIDKAGKATKRFNDQASALGSIRYAAMQAGAAVQSFNNSSFGDNHRATGGPVQKGKPYIVGEKRPETFIPTENGFIFPDVLGSKTEPLSLDVPPLAPAGHHPSRVTPATELTINLNISPGILTPAAQEELGWVLGPIIRRQIDQHRPR